MQGVFLVLTYGCFLAPVLLLVLIVESVPSYGSSFSIWHSWFWILAAAISVGALKFGGVWSWKHRTLFRNWSELRVRSRLQTIILWGALAFLGTTFFGFLLCAQLVVQNLEWFVPLPGESLLKWLTGVMCSVLGFGLALLLSAVATLRWVLAKSIAETKDRCAGCGYNLSHTSVPSRCPECGQEFDGVQAATM